MQQMFSTRSLYLQVRDVLAGRIATGEWKPGAAIANEVDLAREFGVSQGTMRKALDLLESEHLLSRHQGRGTFVKDTTSEDQAARFCNLRGLSDEPIRGEIRMLEITQGLADELERTRLRLANDEHVCRVKRACSHNGSTFMVEDVSLPSALFPGVADRNISPLSTEVLAQAYGILLGKGEERVSIGVASPFASELMKMPEASPVLLLDRVIMTHDGRPAEWRRAECAPGTMHYVRAM